MQNGKISVADLAIPASPRLGHHLRPPGDLLPKLEPHMGAPFGLSPAPLGGLEKEFT
jgi:hypothetical protein